MGEEEEEEKFSCKHVNMLSGRLIGCYERFFLCRFISRTQDF